MARFLSDIGEFPDSGVANRYKRLGFSVRQGQKLKARLAEEGLIEETLETTEKGSKRVVRLTEKGETLPGSSRG
jgi:predicted transcriptional regulator